MSHIGAERWMQYVKDELPPAERERCEEHLLQCDMCLAVYMECLERSEGLLPGLSDEREFAGQVMARLEEQAPTEIKPSLTGPDSSLRRKRRTWLHHPIFHYTVAAAVTLLLMSTGIFHQLTQQANASAPPSVDSVPLRERPSFSKQMMDKTIRVLDSIEPKKEREATP